ncbi:PAS domain-containing protein [Ensifer adhaerens]|jgi:PAS domain-containing protein|uniref:PAS domain-containing protein n=1 Tax=Ensifer adhaerens TaxID=106592 RepID=UPI000B076E0B
MRYLLVSCAVTNTLPILLGFIDHDLDYRFANDAYVEWLGRNSVKSLGSTGDHFANAELTDVLPVSAHDQTRPDTLH